MKFTAVLLSATAACAQYTINAQGQLVADNTASSASSYSYPYSYASPYTSSVPTSYSTPQYSSTPVYSSYSNSAPVYSYSSAPMYSSATPVYYQQQQTAPAPTVAPVTYYQDQYAATNGGFSTGAVTGAAPSVSVNGGAATPCQWGLNGTTTIVRCQTYNPYTGQQYLGAEMSISDFEAQLHAQELYQAAQTNNCMGVPSTANSSVYEIVCPTTNAYGQQVYSAPMNVSTFEATLNNNAALQYASANGCQSSSYTDANGATQTGGIICPMNNGTAWVWGTATSQDDYIQAQLVSSLGGYNPTSFDAASELATIQSLQKFETQVARKNYETAWQSVYTNYGTANTALRTKVQNAYIAQINATGALLTNSLAQPQYYSTSGTSLYGYSSTPASSGYIYSSAPVSNSAQYYSAPTSSQYYSSTPVASSYSAPQYTYSSAPVSNSAQYYSSAPVSSSAQYYSSAPVMSQYSTPQYYTTGGR